MITATNNLNTVSEVFNQDCLIALKQYPDNYFDLAIVDPPYGIAKNPSKHGGTGSGKLKNRVLNKNAKKFKEWDIKPPQNYVDELLRVSKNQIIWGGNYFELPATRCFVIWDKQQPFKNFSAAEYAWTSFDMPSKIFSLATTRTGETKIHPTQKPVALYDFLYINFTQKGIKVLDTHLGSASNRISAYKNQVDFVGYEIDTDYYTSGNKRFLDEKPNIDQIIQFENTVVVEEPKQFKLL